MPSIATPYRKWSETGNADGRIYLAIVRRFVQEPEANDGRTPAMGARCMSPVVTYIEDQYGVNVIAHAERLWNMHKVIARAPEITIPNCFRLTALGEQLVRDIEEAEGQIEVLPEARRPGRKVPKVRLALKPQARPEVPLGEPAVGSTSEADPDGTRTEDTGSDAAGADTGDDDADFGEPGAVTEDAGSGLRPLAHDPLRAPKVVEPEKPKRSKKPKGS